MRFSYDHWIPDSFSLSTIAESVSDRKNQLVGIGYLCDSAGVSFLTGCIAQASLHDPGCSEKREDESSHRERVEDSSASLTRMHGEVESSQQAHQPKAEQRVPSDVYSWRPEPHSWGWVSLRPEPSSISL